MSSELEFSVFSENNQGRGDLNEDTSSPLTNFDDFVTKEIFNPMDKLSIDLQTFVNTGIFPKTSMENRMLVLGLSNNLPIETKLPAVKVGGNYLYFGEFETKEDLMQLIENPQVLRIMSDTIIDVASNKETKSGGLVISPDSYVSKDLIGTERVWDEYGITGEGLTIGVVDSGIDFGVSDLSTSPALLPSGFTASFDPTGAGLGFATLYLESEIVSGVELLPMEGKNITFWMTDETNIGNTAQMGIALQNLEITEISRKSVSGNYSIGIMYEPGFVEGMATQYFLFVIVDSVISGLYDTVYIDFSTSLAISLARDGAIFESGDTYLRLADWSLNDEEPFSKSNPILARDLDGDGVNDVSAGAFSTTWDRFGLYTGELIEGIDPRGVAIALMYDPISHGTQVASALAGRGTSEIALFDQKDTLEIEDGTGYNLSGSAPGAKIIATKGLTISDFILGWLWIAGMQPDFAVGGWVSTEEHLVDISTNSWGSALPGEDNQLKGMDFNSLFLDLLSTPDLLYDGYPGIIFVVASGNGGSGYGSIASPGSASMAITVGASNSFHALGNTDSQNDVAWFSARGPTPYGAIKPDVVAPGNTGFTNLPVITGLGNGSLAGGQFGGTSESAPRVAGVIALISQMMIAKGMPLTLEYVRLLLKGTATDLGFPPSAQGAGLVNAYEAINSLDGNDRVILTSTYQSVFVGSALDPAFSFFFQSTDGTAIPHPLSDNPLRDVIVSASPEMFEGGIVIQPIFGNGSSVDTNFFDISVERLELVDSDSFVFQSLADISKSIILDDFWDFDNQYLQSIDLLQISLSLLEQSWEDLSQFGYSMPEIFLVDGADGSLIYNEISQSTYVQQLFSGNPDDDFDGSPALNFTDPGYANEIPGWEGLIYSGFAQLFDYISWNSIDVIKDPSSVSLEGNLAEESQFASIRVISQSTTYSDYRIPLFIPHIEKVQFGNAATYVGDEISTVQPYDLTSVYGAFDWNFRPESGDTRFYSFEVPANATYLAIQAKWNVEGVIPNLYLFNENGTLELTSDVEYVGAGLYNSKTSSPFTQNLLLPVEGKYFYLLVQVTETPFTADRFDLEIWSRYLVTPTIPPPTPVYSQQINGQIAGDLTIDVSNYSLAEFPELSISKLEAEMLQGQTNFVFDFIGLETVINGTPSSIDELENKYFLFFEQGEKVELSLIWDSPEDLDLYVFAPGQDTSLDNDLLFFQGTTALTGRQTASFAAPVTGTYSIYIDYYDGLSYQTFSEGNFTVTEVFYNFEWNSFKGPTLIVNDNILNVDTASFANGNYLLNLTQFTNFRTVGDDVLRFVDQQNINLQNHFNFTSSILGPQSGIQSQMITVKWDADTDVQATISLVIDRVEYILADGLEGSEFSFDSSFYPNGDAILRIEITDGQFIHQYAIPIVLSNSDVSTIPDNGTTNGNSLDISLIFYFGIVMAVVFAKFRQRSIKS